MSNYYSTGCVACGGVLEDLLQGAQNASGSDSGTSLRGSQIAGINSQVGTTPWDKIGGALGGASKGSFGSGTGTGGGSSRGVSVSVNGWLLLGLAGVAVVLIAKRK